MCQAGGFHLIIWFKIPLQVHAIWTKLTMCFEQLADHIIRGPIHMHDIPSKYHTPKSIICVCKCMRTRYGSNGSKKVPTSRINSFSDFSHSLTIAYQWIITEDSNFQQKVDDIHESLWLRSSGSLRQGLYLFHRQVGSCDTAVAGLLWVLGCSLCGRLV